jgi:hypothetical protein
MIPFILAGAAAVYAAVKAKDVLTYADVPNPPKPPAPPVPTGGYSGPVTDPRAVDVMIAQSSAQTRGAYQDFFNRLPDLEYTMDSGSAGGGNNGGGSDIPWLWIGAGAVGAVLLVKAVR